MVGNSGNTGLGRMTLDKIPRYPSPSELYDEITKSEGWSYTGWPKETAEEKQRIIDRYHLRDRALVSLTYLIGSRESETLRLRKKQFIREPKEKRILVDSVELSKSYKKGKQRNVSYRLGYLPLTGEREPLSRIVLEYIETLEPEDKLFKFKEHRAWEIAKAILPNSTFHWLRAYCENYLYDNWDHDLLAVSDYIKVDGRTLQKYIRRSYEKYKTV